MLSNELYFTNYRISTITSGVYLKIPNFNKKININLILLFDNIKILNEKDNFIFTQRISNNEKIIRGFHSKKKRNSNKKRTFDNQISFVYMIDNNYYPNIKVFQNGNLHITGCRNLDDIKKPLNSMINEIKKIFNIEKNNLISNLEENEVILLNELTHDEIKIFMINTDFKIFTDIEEKNKFNIKRRILHEILIIDDVTIARFDPSTYPGVKIEYWWTDNTDINSIKNQNEEILDKTVYNRRNIKKKIININNYNEKKITIAVFESGSILITGAVTLNQVNEAYNYICNIINKNKDSIHLNLVN